jgi:hypothetical protein
MTFKFIKTVLTTCRYAMCISLGVLSVSGTASATLIESIAALEEGAMYRVLFVTSGLTTALSSDIVDYNTFVSTAAGSGSVTGSLGLTWKALASTDDVDAQENTDIYNHDAKSVTMFNTRGQILAISGADLWNGTLANQLRYDENGSTVYIENAFTGTNKDGSKSGATLGDAVVRVRTGDIGVYNAWIDSNDYEESWNELPFYAASHAVVKPQADVPEPGTVILLSLGLAGLSFARYRKQF